MKKPPRTRQLGPTLYCGDPHGRFEHIVNAAGQTRASTVVLLGDLTPTRPLEVELAPLLKRGVAIHFIHGNHDADSDEIAERVWSGPLAECNVHAKVVTLPDRTRLAGLGGVFRHAVWYPVPVDAAPTHRTREDHAQVTPRQHRWKFGTPRHHLGSIYMEDIARLETIKADVLITHEAPGYHPRGFDLVDALARIIGAKVCVHGHHHDRRDSSTAWPTQGFKSFGVGLRGISAITADGDETVIVPGELDDKRRGRH